MEEVMKDERFSHIFTDPRFRKMPKGVQRVTVDKRFKVMFKDKKFKEKFSVDKRGRPLNLMPAENLKNLYRGASESEDDGVDDKLEVSQGSKSIDGLKEITEEIIKEKVQKESSNPFEELLKKKSKLEKKQETVNNQVCASGDSDSESNSGTPESEEEDDKLEISHGKNSDEDSTEESDESDDSESEDSSIDKEEFDHQWEELRNEAPDTDQITRRLAVCNMDWDRIRAEDLYAAFDSFKPANGCISSVKIYPSEFGLKRMEEEKLNGPPELVEEVLDPEAEDEDEDAKGSKYHREKLRQYQINRLKYYYAVIDCDSPQTANTLYEQLNGMEYESSSVRFDIRFIPDDVSFDYEPVSSTDKAPDPTEYKPRLFVTTALQQVKVNLTWDETDPKRRETLQKAFTEPESIEKDIRDYLASSSSESEVYEENEDDDASKEDKLTTKERIAKYRALLQSLEDKKKDEEEKYEMEITWEPGLKEKTEEIVKEKVQKESLNPFEELLKKKKEGKKLKKKQKAENNKVSRSSASGDSDSESDSESNTRLMKVQAEERKKLAELALISDSKTADFFDKNHKGKGKNKKSRKEKFNSGKSADFKCNVNDPRFSAIYSSPLFNIDPSDPHFKKTDANLALIQEKQKRVKYDSKEERNFKRTKYL